MNDSAHKFTRPKHTIFGEPFIQEGHIDAADRKLSTSDIGKVIILLKAAMLYELMKSLRSALYLHRKD